MATQVYPTFSKSCGETGASREFWVKMTGLVGATSAATINTVENPFDEDMVIHEALLVVTTASGAVDTGLDIGLANDVDGGSADTLLSLDLEDEELNTVQVLELGILHAVAAPPLRLIWKAPNAAGTATDSWLAFVINASVAAGDLRYNCLVKVMPYADLI